MNEIKFERNPEKTEKEYGEYLQRLEDIRNKNKGRCLHVAIEVKDNNLIYKTDCGESVSINLDSIESIEDPNLDKYTKCYYCGLPLVCYAELTRPDNA